MYKIGIIPEFTILAIPYSVRKAERSLHYILVRIILFFYPTCRAKHTKEVPPSETRSFPAKQVSSLRTFLRAKHLLRRVPSFPTLLCRVGKRSTEKVGIPLPPCETRSGWEAPTSYVI